MTLSKQELSGLVERVREQKGPEREVDLALLNAFDLPGEGLQYIWGAQAIEPGSTEIAVLIGTGPEAENPHYQQYVRDAHSDISVIRPPRFTASVDAALALVERVQPGWMVSIDQRKIGWFATLVEFDRDANLVIDDHDAEASTAPLAILLALLLSLQSQEPK